LASREGVTQDSCGNTREGVEKDPYMHIGGICSTRVLSQELAPSAAAANTPANPPWLEHALTIRQEFPTASPFSIAVELQAVHGVRLSPDTVQAALQAHDAKQL
jgi:hypothetical protein